MGTDAGQPLFERLIAQPPRNVDVMLMEGSTLGRLNAEQAFPTEADIEGRFVDLFRNTAGLALVAASAQNIDRMVSLYRACKRSGRTLLIDLYTAEILRATGNANIPQSDWPHVAVYMPHYQRVQVKRSGRFDLLEPHGAQRIYPEALAALAPRAAMVFRPAMLRDLDRSAFSPAPTRSGANGTATSNSRGAKPSWPTSPPAASRCRRPTPRGTPASRT